MAEINYSIIIPHKNSPKLLQRCLDSIPKRSDVQIIVVDDNSNPDKVDFEHFPGLQDSFIEVYLTKEGKGAGYARNVGLKYAKGKWLLFADADDYYVKGFIRQLDSFLDSEYDIIFFPVLGNGPVECDRSCEINTFYDLYFRNQMDIEIFKYKTWVPWNKMFRRQFIVDNSIFFEEIPVGNDAFFSLYASEKTKKILVIQNKIYCVTYNPNSITYSDAVFRKKIDYLSVNLRISSFLEKHGIQLCVTPFGEIFKLYGLGNLFLYMRCIYSNSSLWKHLCLYTKKKLRLL